MTGTRIVQLVMGIGFVFGAVLLGVFQREGWGWMILGAFLCIPGCMA